MALSLQECIDKIKKEYPNCYPHTYVEFEGKYVFNLIPKGTNSEMAISDIHVVDPENGYITGGISIMEFLKDAKFREVWKHANLVANHDKSLEHGSVFRLSDERGWRVRRNQNGSNLDLSYGGTLMHHGIKGQAWGVRNGPPYPLDQKTHNKVIKGRATRESPEKKETPKKVRFHGSNSGLARGISGKTEQTPDSKPKGNDKLKKAAIATASVLSVVAVGALVAKSPKVQEALKASLQNRFDEANRMASADFISDIVDIDKKFSSENPPRQIIGEHSVEDDMAACNPKYYKGVIQGTSNNCALCSFTYDLRRRGYDVSALCSVTGNYPDQLTKRIYNDAQIESPQGKSFSEVYANMARKYPEGARGQISVFGSNTGHVMAWEIRNGKLDVIDAQRNVRVSADEIEQLGFIASKTKMARLDNLEINYDAINAVSAEYKRPWTNASKRAS